MATLDLIIHVFCLVDDRMHSIVDTSEPGI